jgi:signal transduction histidine kinase
MTDPIQPSRASIDYDLLSHIAHEARGPYNGLIGFSDLLDSNFDALPVERQKEYIHLVKLLASKSFFQLQTVIAWLKLVSGNFKVNHSPFYITESIRYAIQYNANDTKGKFIEIVGPTEETGKINGDLNYINIALANIIAVALLYIEKHSTIQLSVIGLPKQEFMVQIVLHTTSDPEELKQLIQLAGTSPDQVPEAKTGLWVAAQILKYHRFPVSIETDTKGQAAISIRFSSIS